MSNSFPNVQRVYLNGEFLAADEARVSAFDRGFLFGDGIYEVIPAYGGRPFRWREHLQRLNANLDAVGIGRPLDAARWEEVALGLLDVPAAPDLYLYVQVTRGVAPRDHVFPAAAEPTVFAYSNLLPPIPAEQLEQGVAAITLPEIRWLRCDLKTTSLIANVWLRQQAEDAGAAEAILTRDDQVTEGSATNVFAVFDGEVRTPPLGKRLLPGVTRNLVVELMQRFVVPHREQDFTRAQLLRARECWVTSSTREVLPVTRIDGAPVGDGLPGPLFRRVYKLFQQFKQQSRAGKTA